jgi:hypothetical protein
MADLLKLQRHDIWETARFQGFQTLPYRFLTRRLCIISLASKASVNSVPEDVSIVAYKETGNDQQFLGG